MKVENVSDTAFWVAHYRAKESKRPNALFKDPLAQVLAGEKGEKIANQMRRSIYVDWHVVIRTFIIDATIQKLVASGEIDGVLNLGCGLDTRPYRLNLPVDFKWVEVDFPGVIEFKEEKLKQEKPLFHLERIKLDLTDPKLRQNLFRQMNQKFSKLFVLTEGVIPYLSNGDVEALGKGLRAQSNFKYWMLEYTSPQMTKIIKTMRKDDLKNAPFLFDPENWESFFSKIGWEIQERQYISIVSKSLGRPSPMPLIFKIAQFFMPPEKKTRMSQMSGYALMKNG